MDDMPSTSVSDMDDNGLAEALLACPMGIRSIGIDKPVTLDFPCIWVKVRAIFMGRPHGQEDKFRPVAESPCFPDPHPLLCPGYAKGGS